MQFSQQHTRLTPPAQNLMGPSAKAHRWRRGALCWTGVLGLMLTGGCTNPTPTQESSATVLQLTSDLDALQVAGQALIIDTHIDVPYRLHKEYEDVSVSAGGDFDWPRANAGGLNAAFMRSIFRRRLTPKAVRLSSLTS